jgi:hypothetical protein
VVEPPDGVLGLDRTAGPSWSPVFRGHELYAQTVWVLEGEDCIAETVAGSLEADAILYQALCPVA